MWICRDIHTPVPLFKSELQRSVERFLSRVSPNKPFLRANWGVCHPPLSLCLPHNPLCLAPFERPLAAASACIPSVPFYCRVHHSSSLELCAGDRPAGPVPTANDKGGEGSGTGCRLRAGGCHKEPTVHELHLLISCIETQGASLGCDSLPQHEQRHLLRSHPAF